MVGGSARLTWSGSGGSLDLEAERNRRGLHLPVIRDDRTQVGTEELRAGEMKGVQGAQRHSGGQSGCDVEKIRVEAHLVDPGELPACVGYRLRASRHDSAHDLYSGKSARHLPVVAMPAQESPQGGGLCLSLDELHECRRVDVQLHRSSARIAARVAEACTP